MRRRSVITDDAHLAALGIKQELQRNFSPLSMLGLAFATLNSWTAFSTSLNLALPSGGPTVVLWGLVAAGLCNLCLAASLAEFLSAFPSAGGQYHWVAVISWKRYMPILSWVTGWINVFGWMALVAVGGLLGSQLILGIVAMHELDFTPQPWQQFLIFIGYILVTTLLNAFANSLLPLVNKAAIVWSVLGFVVISITVLACASPNYNSADVVFRQFQNETNWPDGVAWLLGLLQAGLGLTGFDATAHMIEEIPNAAIEGPKIMIYCVAIGIGTGFVFLVCLLFVAGSIPDVIESRYGPLGQIILHATGSRPGTVCLLIFPLVCIMFATNSAMTTSSRMTYAFARDGGLPFSKFFARVHKKLDVPLEALGLTTLVVVIFGLILIGSSSAFSAIIAASVVALGISYAMPVAINCLRGRRMLPSTRAFIMPEWFAWIANIIGVCYVVLTTVLFLFPPELPVNGMNMNYCVVAFAIVFAISMITWIFDGRKNFTGPKFEINHHVLSAEEVSSEDFSPNQTRDDINEEKKPVTQTHS